MSLFKTIGKTAAICSATALGLGFAAAALAQDSGTPDGIIQDSEYQLLWEQHGTRWAAEDTRKNSGIKSTWFQDV